jgi:hypothetical protein
MKNTVVKSFEDWSLNEDDFSLDTPATTPAPEPPVADAPVIAAKDISTMNFEQLNSYDYFVDNKSLVIVTDCAPNHISEMYQTFVAVIQDGYEHNFDNFLRDKGFVAIAALKAGMIKTK